MVYTHDFERHIRKRIAKRDFNNIGSRSVPLTPEERKEIIEFWKPYRDVTKHLHWFEFYKASCQDLTKLKYYLPDSIYYTEIDIFFNSPRRCQILDDKNLYDLFFHDVKMPGTIVRKVNGQLMDNNYNLLTLEQAVERCQNAREGVGKTARMSGGAHGVQFFDFSSITDDVMQYLNRYDDFIIQETIQQHEFFNNIHASSINTLRIMTLFLNGEVNVVSSVFRMGAGGSRVDNGSSGGVFVGVNPDGTLMEFAHYTDGRTTTQHPQGTVFKGLKVVGYDSCVRLAKKLSLRFLNATKLISWDFAVDPDGDPVLIETNLTYGGLSTHQLSKGPLYGERTAEILSLVYSKGKKNTYYES